MSNHSSSDHAKSTKLGWKFVALVGILTAIFFTGLYSAMTYEPDYMIEHRQKTQSQHVATQPQHISNSTTNEK